MSHDQEKSGRALRPLPDKEETSPLNELANSLPATTGTGSDNLRDVGAGLACGQYQYGGTVPIVAPAARVSPVVREVQL